MVETVVVTDKSGKPVEGLTAKDFTVTEERRAADHPLLRASRPAGDSGRGAPAVSARNTSTSTTSSAATQIAPESPGSTRYKDRRLLALYFDMTAMPPADQLRALAAAEKFIRTQMTPADLLAILRYSGGAVDVLQDFTGDRDRLLSIIETMIVGEGQGLDETTGRCQQPRHRRGFWPGRQ